MQKTCPQWQREEKRREERVFLSFFLSSLIGGFECGRFCLIWLRLYTFACWRDVVEFHFWNSHVFLFLNRAAIAEALDQVARGGTLGTQDDWCALAFVVVVVVTFFFSCFVSFPAIRCLLKKRKRLMGNFVGVWRKKRRIQLKWFDFPPKTFPSWDISTWNQVGCFFFFLFFFFFSFSSPQWFSGDKYYCNLHGWNGSEAQLEIDCP